MKNVILKYCDQSIADFLCSAVIIDIKDQCPSCSSSFPNYSSKYAILLEKLYALKKLRPSDTSSFDTDFQSNEILMM